MAMTSDISRCCYLRGPPLLSVAWLCLKHCVAYDFIRITGMEKVGVEKKDKIPGTFRK